jgi:hypothetical protein
MPAVSFRALVIRPEDLLILELEFQNVNFVPPTAVTPGLVSGGTGARLVVHFPPQHITEQAFFKAGDVYSGPQPVPGDEPPLPPGQVAALPAGPSRLVFNIPATVIIPYKVEDILTALTTLPLAVAPVAGYAPLLQGCVPLASLIYRMLVKPPVITKPLDIHTAIEAPWHLIVSPDQMAHWQHASAPVTHDQRTELWHTTLGTHRPGAEPSIRAIWSPDFLPNTVQEHSILPFRMSLDARDRNELVHLTSNWWLGGFVPRPVEAERLMLTPLGAYLRLQGYWDNFPPPFRDGKTLTVEQWRHTATLGRDHYVRVVYAGYLLPFGHRASLVKVTERKYLFRRDIEPNGYVAYLYQRTYIIVREPEKTYVHREIPFRKITIKTRVTPDLANPDLSQIGTHSSGAFWPKVIINGNDEYFQFHCTGVDWEGRTIEFSAPVIFVDRSVDNSAFNEVVTAYNAVDPGEARRQRPLGGQSVAYAPSKKSGDTTLVSDSISFAALAKIGLTPHFWPGMARASVDIPAVRQLLGKPSPSTIQFEDTYLTGSGEAIGNNPAVFVKVTSATALKFATEKTGGMVAPDISITGLSRELGPVGGPLQEVLPAGELPKGLLGGHFNPWDIFDLSVKLLGGIELSKILQQVNFGNPSAAGTKVPGFTSVREGNAIRTSYIWKMSADCLKNTILFVPKSNAEFSLDASVLTPLDGTTPQYKISGKITNFGVLLLPAVELVQVDFKAVEFVSENNKKADVNVDLETIQFKGILEFVNKLSEMIPIDGFSDPPILDIGADGITLGYSLGLPTVGIGIMSIQNISFAASLYLPFVDKPLNFHFAFCKRESPFLLTVSLFGGGGFFSIDIGIAGVQRLEAALEFGASVAINLGVASGKASIMAGFYFQMTSKGFELTGYFRASGSLSVLGIISISCEFYLGLTFASKGLGGPHAGKLWGQCKITVKISILFFSISVGISMEREFAGSDPNFQQLVGPSEWTTYCDAFSTDYPLVNGG